MRTWNFVFEGFNVITRIWISKQIEKLFKMFPFSLLLQLEMK